MGDPRLHGLNQQQVESIVLAMTGMNINDIGKLLADFKSLEREYSRNLKMINEETRSKDEWIKIKGPRLQEQIDLLKKENQKLKKELEALTK